MLEATRNALLKILEDPPPRCSFILLTTQRGAIIPTILSRVRSYGFRERNSKETKEVLKRVFREEEKDHDDLRSFFLSFNSDLELVKKGAAVFLKNLEEKSVFDREESEKTLAAGQDPQKTFKLFIKELTIKIASVYPPEKLVADAALSKRAASYNSLFKESLSACETYNISPGLLTERLFYSMRNSW